MRVSIAPDFRRSVQVLMDQLHVSDPTLAVNHIIGCWLLSGCTADAVPVAAQPAPASIADDYAEIIEY